MRPSFLVRGIKNIFPLIKKECPQSIYYPTRFSSLSGYRIAIDATLLVQRFHFSDDEHPARHLIGFHRLIATLRGANVYPIFVFDHLTSRLSIKSRETDRRREAKGRVKARMRVELRRAWRLRVLDSILRRIKEMDDEQKGAVRSLLKLWRDKERRDDGKEDFAKASIDAAAKLQEEVVGPLNQRVTSEWSDFSIQLNQLGLSDEVSHPAMKANEQFEERLDTILSSRNDVGSISDYVAEESLLTSKDNAQHEPDLWQTIYEDQTSSAYAIAARIYDLRQEFYKLQHPHDYGVSSSQCVTTTPRHPHTATQIEMDGVEEKLYNALAEGIDLSSLEKSGDLTWKMVEGKISESIQEIREADLAMEKSAEKDAEKDAEKEDQEAASSALQASERPSETGEDPARDNASREDQRLTSLEIIRERSLSLQKSYARHSSPLPSNVFDDSAMLCTLLNAPVLWTGSGSPYGGAKGEAEALAASLVSIGEADAVATEDSDVLLAEVPLIRHLTGSKKPMELIDSRAVRIGLFPIKVEQGPMAKRVRSGKGAEAEVNQSAEEQEEERLATLSRADKLSRSAMLEFALLCGTDYNRTIPGLASRGALRLMREHQTIRGILKSGGAASKYKPPEGLDWKEYGAELSRAKAVFKNPPDAKRALSIAGIKASPSAKAGMPVSELDSPLEEKKAGIPLQIPERPPISLIDSLKQEMKAAPGEARIGDDNNRRIFEIPDYDRHAVLSFLREKGLGKGRYTSTFGDDHSLSPNSRAQAEEWMMLSPDLAKQEGIPTPPYFSDFTSSATTPGLPSQGFGPALGGEVVLPFFDFDRIPKSKDVCSLRGEEGRTKEAH